MSATWPQPAQLADPTPPYLGGPVWRHQLATPLSTLQLCLELMAERQHQPQHLAAALTATQQIKDLCFASKSERFAIADSLHKAVRTVQALYPQALIHCQVHGGCLTGIAWLFEECMVGLMSQLLSQQSSLLVIAQPGQVQLCCQTLAQLSPWQLLQLQRHFGITYQLEKKTLTLTILQ